MLDYDGFRPVNSRYLEPLRLPRTEPDASPGSAVTLSCEWWSYVLGAVGHLLDQGAWNSTDPAELTLVTHRVEQLRWMIAAAGNAGDCAFSAMDCSYDFALSQANPWVVSPTLTQNQSTWGLIVGWVGGYNVIILPDWSEVAIQADYIPFTLTGFTVAYALPSTGLVEQPWSARFYDHRLNLLYELADTGGNPVVYSGPPIQNVCRIIVHRRQNAFGLTDIACVEQVYIQGLSVAGACQQLVPLADPPGSINWCYSFDLKQSFPSIFYIGAGVFEVGVGVHNNVSGSDPYSVYITLTPMPAGLSYVEYEYEHDVSDPSAYLGIFYDPIGTRHGPPGANTVVGTGLTIGDADPLITQTYCTFAATNTNGVPGGNVITRITLRGYGIPPYGNPNC